MKGRGPHRTQPALLLALGFALSAVTAFAAVRWLGAAILGGWHGSAGAWVAAVGLLAALVLADLGVLGLKTPMWRRQAPQWYMYRFQMRTSAFFWGLDTGLVATTVRVTSLSWAGLGVTFLGLLPWWAGVVYAVGFIVPELVAIVLIPKRTSPDDGDRREPRDPTWLLDLLGSVRPRMRQVGLSVMAGSAGVATLALVIP